MNCLVIRRWSLFLGGQDYLCAFVKLGRQMSLERQIRVQEPVTNGHGVFYSVFVQYKTLLLFCCVKLEIIREID